MMEEEEVEEKKKKKKKKKKEKRKNKIGVVRQSVFSTKKQNFSRFPACSPSSIR